MYKKIICLCLSLLISFSVSIPINAKNTFEKNITPLSIPEHVSNQFTYKQIENGVSIIIPNQVVTQNQEYFEGFIYNIDNQNNLIQPMVDPTTFFGAVLVSLTAAVIYSCVFDRGPNNACVQIYGWLTTPIITNLGIQNSKNVRLAVYREYHSGRVPGCEPMHSYQCNSGYWEVRFVRES